MSARRSPWRPYTPSAETPWNLRRVVHLHRRAAFGATWPELQRDLRAGPHAAVGRLLAGPADTDTDAMADQLARAAAQNHDALRLQASWVFRMLLGSDPLGERLTLMWHNHFATSHLKVGLAAMQRQNALLRAHARAPFGQLLRAVMRDSALLIWLDAPQNRARHPNENLARELMELFTLGVGHYTETDVKEAARALTGWTVIDGGFAHRPDRHDDGEKTILGERAAYDGDALLTLLLDQPATAQRLAWRLCDQFLGEGVAEMDAIGALADQLAADDLHIGNAVATVLHSERFFSRANLGSRVSDPAAHVVAALRALEAHTPPPRTILVAEWVARLGQQLFAPPNVGGWPGGRSWLSSRTLIARCNFAHALVTGTVTGRPRQPDLETLAQRHANEDLSATTAWLSQLLLGEMPPDPVHERLHLLAQRDGATAAAAALLMLPAYQLA